MDTGEQPTLYALSPEDGKILKTLSVSPAKPRGVAWHNGKLLLISKKPNVVWTLDPQTGKTLSAVNLKGGIVYELAGADIMGDKIWVCDDFCPCIWEYDPAKPGKPVEAPIPTQDVHPRYVGLAGPGPYDIAVMGDTAWHCDWLQPALICSNRKGKLVDWGEKPAEDLTGITYDGKNLWVLDNKTKRICIIEKTPTGKNLARPQ